MTEDTAQWLELCRESLRKWEGKRGYDREVLVLRMILALPAGYWK